LRSFPHDITRTQELTPREREVIDYVAQGKSNKVIAMELDLSMRTVETHRARIFRKMRVRNATELARRVYAPQSWENARVVALHEPGIESEHTAAPPPIDDDQFRQPPSS